MISAFRALQSQVSYIKAKKLALKERNGRLMQNAFSALHIDSAEKVSRLSEAFLFGRIGISVKVDQGLVSGPARKLNELCSDRRTIPGSWQNRSDQSSQRAIQA